VRALENGNPIMNGPISVGPSGGIAPDASEKGSKPVDRSKGLWTRCDKCGVILYIKHLKEHHHICFGCNYHLKMTSEERIEHLIDPGARGAGAAEGHRGPPRATAAGEGRQCGRTHAGAAAAAPVGHALGPGARGPVQGATRLRSLAATPPTDPVS
jgi:hypothetical protein